MAVVEASDMPDGEEEVAISLHMGPVEDWA